MGASEGTEKPTPKRIRDAQKKGDVARSAALSFAAAGLVMTWMAGWRLGGFPEKFGAALELCLRSEGDWKTSLAGVMGLFSTELAVIPLGALFITAVVGLFQTGLVPATEKIGRLEIFSLRRIFNSRSFYTAPLSLLVNLAFCASGAWLVGKVSLQVIALSVSRLPFYRIFIETSLGAAWKLAAAAAIYGLLDLLFRRRSHMKRLMMTQRELREEVKESEGDPVVKSRRRRLYRLLTMNNLKQGVRSARAVVVNPTHVAVALKYDEGDEAPAVSYKGEGGIARMMREEAEAAGVPVVRDVFLARAIYFSLEVEDEIPPELYKAVAGVFHAAAKALSDGVRVVDMA